MGGVAVAPYVRHSRHFHHSQVYQLLVQEVKVYLLVVTEHFLLVCRDEPNAVPGPRYAVLEMDSVATDSAVDHSLMLVQKWEKDVMTWTWAFVQKFPSGIAHPVEA